MIRLENIKRVYFLGIGGIGMSALARHFVHIGKEVYGYDRIETPLTHSLTAEGMLIQYDDSVAVIPEPFVNAHRFPENLIIYTPAIPDTNLIMNHLLSLGYQLYKRSQVLGMFSEMHPTIAIAGSHGKSTVSAMLTQVLWEEGRGCNAFLGAISKNINSNYSQADEAKWTVMEADEFDRSFLTLHPRLALVTSMDRDHLDIYDDADDISSTFTAFLNRVEPGSVILLKKGLDIRPDPSLSHLIRTYSLDQTASDYRAEQIEQEGLGYTFTLLGHGKDSLELRTRIPGMINVENAVAAAAIALEAGISPAGIRKGIEAFEGLNRRFDIRFNQSGVLYMDDYAHHPNEIKALLHSVRTLFPGKKLVGIFQPHLFTRTRDFADEFAQALSGLDELLLLDIYPAREEPIPGVDSGIIANRISAIPHKRLLKENVLDALNDIEFDVLLTIGAGDIDQLVNPITEKLEGHAQ